VYLEQGVRYKDAGAAAHDGFDGDLSAAVQTIMIGALDSAGRALVGKHIVKYFVTNSAGIAECEIITREVLVRTKV
jgi:hypothetical protein